MEQQQAGEVQQAVKQEQQAGAGTAARAFYGGGAGAAPRPAGGAVAAAAAAGVGPSRQPSECQQLWVEKWRPKTTAELVGNNVSASLGWSLGCDGWPGLHAALRSPAAFTGSLVFI